MSRNNPNSKYGDPASVIFKWMMIAVFALLVAISLGGCNTVRGFGQMVQGMGQDLEEASNGIQHQMSETDI